MNILPRRAIFAGLAAAPFMAVSAKAQTVPYSGYQPSARGAFHAYSSQEQYVTAYSRCQPLYIDTVEFCDLGALAHLVLFNPYYPHTTGCLVIDQDCYADLRVNLLFRTPSLGQVSQTAVNVTALIEKDYLAESLGTQGGESSGYDNEISRKAGETFNVSAVTQRIYKCSAGDMFWAVPCCNYDCYLTNADSTSGIDTVNYFEGSLWR